MSSDVSKSNLGRHDWIRTSDLFRVKASIHCTFNILQAAGDCQTTRKYAEGGHLTGDFAGEKRNRVPCVSNGGKVALLPGQSAPQEFLILVHVLSDDVAKGQPSNGSGENSLQDRGRAIAFVVAQTIDLSTGRSHSAGSFTMRSGFVLSDIVSALMMSPAPSETLKKLRRRAPFLAEAFKGGDNLSPPLRFPLKRWRDGTTGSARTILPDFILPLRPAHLSIQQVFVAVLLCLAGKAGIRGRECWRLWEG
jgi:hypothetical protein